MGRLPLRLYPGILVHHGMAHLVKGYLPLHLLIPAWRLYASCAERRDAGGNGTGA